MTLFRFGYIGFVFKGDDHYETSPFGFVDIWR